MIVRELKLKLTKGQEKTLGEWLGSLTSIYNWGIRKIELNARDRIYFSRLEFRKLLDGHGKKLGIPSHTIRETLDRAWLSWHRCFKKLGRRPRLKGIHNKLRSIPFPDPMRSPEEGRISIPGLGRVRFHRQALPEGPIKRGLMVKRASGWYLQLTLDVTHTFPVRETGQAIGIDPGFKHLVTLSNGERFDCNGETGRLEKRLAQAQRGRDRRLVSRLQERIANKRKDRNHKLSREIVESYGFIAIPKDNLKGMARKAPANPERRRARRKRFGKSVTRASINQLFRFVKYKGDNHGRRWVEVDPKWTTLTCSNCGALSGPTGLSELAVRFWECSECGVGHDRDVNAARNILRIGLGSSLKAPCNGGQSTGTSCQGQPHGDGEIMAP